MSNPFDALASSGDAWRRPSLSASSNSAYLAAVDSALSIEKSKEQPARRKSHNVDMFFHDIQPGYAMGTENKELRSQLSQLQAQVESLSQQLVNATNSKHQLETEVASLRSKLTENYDMSAMLTESKNRIRQLESSLAEAQRQSTSKLSTYSTSSSNTALDEANKAIKLLQARLGTKDQMIQKLSHQNEQLCIKNEELKDIIDKVQQSSISPSIPPTIPTTSITAVSGVIPPRTPITKRISPPLVSPAPPISSQPALISTSTMTVPTTLNTSTNSQHDQLLRDKQEEIDTLTRELTDMSKRLVVLQDSSSDSIRRANAQYKRVYEAQHQQSLQVIYTLFLFCFSWLCN